MTDTITLVDASNPRWLDVEHTAFDITVDLSDGTVYDRYTVVDWDTTGLAKTLWTNALNGDYGPIAEPLPPVPQVPYSVSRWQLLEGLATMGWISEEEAIAGMESGARPVAVDALIMSLPEADRFKAKMKWASFQNALRDDPLVNALAQAEGKTEAEIDEFFIMCSEIEV